MCASALLVWHLWVVSLFMLVSCSNHSLTLGSQAQPAQVQQLCALSACNCAAQVRRPAQFTYLTAYNLSLKELGTLVNSTYTDSHISFCVQCR